MTLPAVTGQVILQKTAQRSGARGSGGEGLVADDVALAITGRIRLLGSKHFVRRLADQAAKVIVELQEMHAGARALAARDLRQNLDIAAAP